MTRYECHGILSISHRPSFCDVSLTHEIYHEPYDNISIPSQWLDFIAKKHDLGPTTVCGLHLN